MKAATHFTNRMYVDDRYPQGEDIDPDPFLLMIRDIMEEFDDSIVYNRPDCDEANNTCARVILFDDLSMVFLGVHDNNVYFAAHNSIDSVTEAMTKAFKKDEVLARQLLKVLNLMAADLREAGTQPLH